VIAGNYIGTNAAGTAAVANGFSGILVWAGADNTRIGTDGNGIGDLAEQNVISGNLSHGVDVRNDGTTNTWVAGNLIGTDFTGTQDLGNAVWA
jgi:titin